MNISVLVSGKDAFIHYEYVKGYTYKTMSAGENSALLAKFNHMLAAKYAVLWGKYTLFTENRDCFECLSPMSCRYYDRISLQKYSAA